MKHLKHLQHAYETLATSRSNTYNIQIKHLQHTYETPETYPCNMVAPEKDGGARISPLRISEWGATVDGRPLVLPELVPEKDGGARISPLRITKWGATMNGDVARDGTRRSRARHGRGARGPGRGTACAWVGTLLGQRRVVSEEHKPR
jgi:hypothetical protein